MNRIRTLSPLAILFTATALGAPATAAPATGPDRYFNGSDLFNLEVAGDPQISPDGRTIAYVRRSNDIMTDKARSTIWLVDVASGQPMVDNLENIEVLRDGRPFKAADFNFWGVTFTPDARRY